MIDLLVDLKELIQLKTYKGHKGRPGKKGGSLPKGQSATKFVDESDQDNKKYWNTTVDKIGMPNGSVKNAYVASGRLVQSYGQNTDQAELDRLFTEKTGQKMDYRYDEEWGGGWSENSGYTINEEYYPDNDSPDASM